MNSSTMTDSSTDSSNSMQFTADVLQAPAEELVCWCHAVSKQAIQASLNAGAATFAEIKEQTNACGGGDCKNTNPRGRCCSKEIMCLLEAHLARTGKKMLLNQYKKETGK